MALVCRIRFHSLVVRYRGGALRDSAVFVLIGILLSIHPIQPISHLTSQMDFPSHLTRLVVPLSTFHTKAPNPNAPGAFDASFFFTGSR